MSVAHFMRLAFRLARRGGHQRAAICNRSMRNNLPKRHSLSENEAMKTVLQWLCALLLIALADGCATHGGKTAETKKADSAMEQPAEKTGPEIHGYISVGVGGRIK